jgi:hypothetical protein
MNPTAASARTTRTTSQIQPVLDPFEPDAAPVFVADAALVEVVLVDVELTEGAFVDVGAGTTITAGRVVVVSGFVAGGLVGGVVSGGAVVGGVVAAGRAGCVGFVVGSASALDVLVVTFDAVLVGRATAGRLTVGRDSPPLPPEPQAATAMIPTSTHARRCDLPGCEFEVSTQRRARSTLMVILDSRHDGLLVDPTPCPSVGPRLRVSRVALGLELLLPAGLARGQLRLDGLFDVAVDSVLAEPLQNPVGA